MRHQPHIASHHIRIQTNPTGHYAVSKRTSEQSHFTYARCSTRWGFTLNGLDKNDIFIDELPEEEKRHIFIQIIICHF